MFQRNYINIFFTAKIKRMFSFQTKLSFFNQWTMTNSHHVLWNCPTRSVCNPIEPVGAQRRPVTFYFTLGVGYGKWYLTDENGSVKLLHFVLFVSRSIDCVVRLPATCGMVYVFVQRSKSKCWCCVDVGLVVVQICKTERFPKMLSQSLYCMRLKM